MSRTPENTEPDRPDPPLLRLSGATKVYGGTRALDGVDFDLHAGEVHALLGENGAGKSTLCKLISGAITLDEGEIELAGEPAAFSTPADAIDAGVSMVYQETSLVPSMTVAQNLRLGDEPWFARVRRLNIEARQVMRSLNFPVKTSSMVSSLGSAHKQMVEIARAIRRNARIVIFDEPTAALTPEEIEQLFGAITRLRERNIGVIFVSHAIEESLQIADRITVLRDGKLRRTAPREDFTREDIVRLMVGRDIEYSRRRTSTNNVSSERALSVDNLTMGSIVKNMSFSLFPGQITGLAGLVGSGRTEAALVAFGATKRDRVNGGRIRLGEEEVRYRVPRQAIRDGIAYVTEDRKLNGFFETMSIAENIHIGHLAAGPSLRLFRRPSGVEEVTQKLIERFQIRTIGSGEMVRELSGGNQQKVVLAKSLTRDPKIAIVDEPTRGVDVGSIGDIHELIRDLAAQGAAVLLISSYLPEIFALSDRILVAREGRIVAEFDPATASEEDVMFAAVH